MRFNSKPIQQLRQRAGLNVPMAIWLIAIIFIGVVIQCGRVHGQVTINSATRSLTSDAANPCVSDPESAMSTSTSGLFQQSVESIASEMGPLCQGNGEGAAMQDTNISLSSINGSGSATASGMFGGDGSGSSVLSVSITVADSTPYTLEATVDGVFEEFFPGMETTPNSGTVRLSNSSLTVFDATSTTVSGETFVLSGMIPSGTYTFEANASASAFSDSRSRSSFNFVFTVPEPSTGSGIVWCLVWIGLRIRMRTRRS